MITHEPIHSRGLAAKQGMNDIWPLIVSKLDNITLGSISMTPLWCDIVPALRRETFWFSRIEWLISCDLRMQSPETLPLVYQDFGCSDVELWEMAFYELDCACHTTGCVTDALVRYSETDGRILALRVLLQIRVFPVNPLGVLSCAYWLGKLDLMELFLQDKRINADPVIITSLIQGAIVHPTRRTEECLRLLLPFANSSDVNANLESGLLFYRPFCPLFLEHPLCEPSERTLELAVMSAFWTMPRFIYLILRNRKFDMSLSLRYLDLAQFLDICQLDCADHIEGYKTGVSLTGGKAVDMTAWQRCVLRVVICQDRTTEEMIEYIRQIGTEDELLHAFTALLDPDMTLRRLTEMVRDVVVMRIICAHLGLQRLRGSGDGHQRA